MQGGFLDRLGAGTLAELVAMGAERRWPVGATIFHEGDPADMVLIIEAGLVKTVAASPDGAETILGLRGPGDVLGELAVIDGGPRSASVVAIQPVTALVVEPGRFREFLAAHADASYGLLQVVAQRVRDASRRQAEYGSLDSTTRLASVLVDLAVDHGRPGAHGTEIALLTQDELAAMTGASRESVARGLRALRDAELVTTDRRRITIRDLDTLTDWSTGSPPRTQATP